MSDTASEAKPVAAAEPDSKAELRRTMRERIADADRVAESADIVRRLNGVLSPIGAILAFEPLSDEPDISPLLNRIRAEGRLALVGGLRDRPEVVPSGMAIVQALVPGRAFDRDGNRLGRGGGTFDRLLAEVPCHAVGVAFDCQIVDHVPTAGHDRRMDRVVTASHDFVVR